MDIVSVRNTALHTRSRARLCQVQRIERRRGTRWPRSPSLRANKHFSFTSTHFSRRGAMAKGAPKAKANAPAKGIRKASNAPPKSMPKAAPTAPKKKTRRVLQYVYKSSGDYHRFFIWHAKRLPPLHPTVCFKAQARYEFSMSIICKARTA